MPLPPGVPADAAAVAVTVTTHRVAGAGLLHGLPGRHRTAADLGGERRRARPDARRRRDRRGRRRPGSTCYCLAGGHVIIDVTGWFTGAAAASGSRRTVRRRAGTATPARHPRRRPDLGRRRRSRSRNVDPNAAALALNVTIVQPIAPGYLTALPRPPEPCRRRAPSTGRASATSPPAWRSCRPRPSASAIYSITRRRRRRRHRPVGSPARPWLPQAGRRPTSARPSAPRAPTRPGSTRSSGAAPRSRAPTTSARSSCPTAACCGCSRTCIVRGRGDQSTFVHNAGLVQNGACFTVLNSGNFASPGRVPVPGPDAASTALVLAARRRHGRPTAVPPVRRRDARERPDVPDARPSRSRPGR